MGRIDFDDMQGAKDYSGSRAYNQSRLAVVMFTYELSRRLHGTTVTANALHPGWCTPPEAPKIPRHWPRSRCH